MRRTITWLWGVLQRREVGTSLALFRIAAGLCVLTIMLPMVATGVHHLVLADVTDGGYRSVAKDLWIVNLLGGPTAAGIDRLCALLAVAATLLVLGLGGRLTALLTLALTLAFFRLNPGSGGGHDRLLTNALWLLVLARSTATLSLDSRIRTGRWTSDARVAAWPRYLAVYQLVVVYTATGVQKLGVDWMPWGGFAALYKALLMPTWRRYDMDWVAWVYPLTQLGTVLTLLFEIGAPVFLLAAFYRDTRTRPGRLRAFSNRVDLRLVWALIGVGLHLGIHAFMNVGPFSWVTLSFYACLWHPDEWRALGRRVLARIGRAPAAQTSP